MILAALQRDATVTLDDLVKRIGLSKSPCWRRIMLLEQSRIIRQRVALLDETKLNLGVSAFVSVRAKSHSPEWVTRFSEVVVRMPEVVEAYRMSGKFDYLLKVLVPDIATYDAFERSLSTTLDLEMVLPKFSLQRFKSTTELPLAYAEGV
ncbi:Lrp/AsnC family transcriptional regulator [Rhizobium sp. BE258]|nr:Lrp/AsnC family transcriptional regulator [Rhizobium sp. BE258]